MTLNNLFLNSQYGFRSLRSRALQLLDVMETWTGWLDEGSSFDCIYYDFAKAFDSVPHARLLPSGGGGGGGGTLIISAYVGSRSIISAYVGYRSPKKNIRNFKHPKKIFEILATQKNITIQYLGLKKRP